MQNGNYTLHMELIVQLRGERDIDGRLQGASIGLLTRAPMSDGTGVEEPSYAGYERLPVTLVPASTNTPTGTLYNAEPMRFPATEDTPAIHHAGLFDATGALLAYGHLVRSTAYVEEPVAFFPATEISLKRNYQVWSNARGFESEEEAERKEAARLAHLAGNG